MQLDKKNPFDKQTANELVKKFTAFPAGRRFLPACHWTLNKSLAPRQRPRSTFVPTCTTSSLTLCLKTKMLYVFLMSHFPATCRAHLVALNLITNKPAGVYMISPALTYQYVSKHPVLIQRLCAPCFGLRIKCHTEIHNS
jgi:hypothetical protein